MNEEVLDDQTAVPSSAVESEVIESTPVDPEAAKQDAVQKRIDEITREKYQLKNSIEQERQAREAAERRLKEFEERNAVQDDGMYDPNQIETLVETKARQLYQQEREREQQISFNQTCNNLYKKGVETDPAFESDVHGIASTGLANNVDYLEFVTSSDKGVEIIQHLAKDLDTAYKLSQMPIHKRAVELARLESKLTSAPTKKQISNAPAPGPSISGKNTGVAVGDLSDFSNFIKWMDS